MSNLQALLDQIDRLDQEATEGPWAFADDDEGLGGRVYEPSGYPLPGCTNCGENDAIYLGGDAEFIAEARTLLPQMAATLQRLLECATTLQEDNQDNSDYSKGVDEAVECFRQLITYHLEADDGQ